MKDRSELALERAQIDADEERQRILDTIKDHPEDDAERIWEEERSVMLRYLEEEIQVAESNIVIRDARRYHLPVPDWSDKHSWYNSTLTRSNYLSPDARRNLQRAILAEDRVAREEHRKDADAQRAKTSTRIAILGICLSALAILSDVPIGDFIVDMTEALKTEPPAPKLPTAPEDTTQ